MEFVLDVDEDIVCQIPVSEWVDLVDGVIDAKALKNIGNTATFRCYGESTLETWDTLLSFLMEMLQGEFADSMLFFMHNTFVRGEYVYFLNTEIMEDE